MNKISKSIYFIIFFLMLASPLLSEPPLPCGFYGSMTILGNPVPVGAIVYPYIDEVKYPTEFVVTTEGQYGLLLVSGDDPSTPETKEGAAPGEKIVFKVKIGGNLFTMIPFGTWTSGVNQNLDLVDDGTVPVELISFSATAKTNSILLSWTTAGETNNLGFEIQRSRDGALYGHIAFLTGYGTTAIPHHYQFEDRDLAAGQYFYRLKQIDTDGSFSFSPVVQLTLTTPSYYQLHQNYPNPFNPETTIRYSISRPGYIILSVYNMEGRRVRALVSQTQYAGSYSITWNGKNDHGEPVSNGVYFCRMHIGNYIRAIKMLFLE